MEYNNDLNAPKTELPNASVILAMGILSIPGCCCYGIVGIICGIIALVLGRTATDLYTSDPGKFTENSYKNINAGKTCAWVGIGLSIIYILTILWLILTFGVAALSDPSIIYEYYGIQLPS